MKNLYNKILIFSAMFLIFSCGNDDLEPTLAMAKSSETGIQDAADLESVLKGAYDRMSSSSYYASAMIINGDLIIFTQLQHRVEIMLQVWTLAQMDMDHGVQFTV